MPSSPFLVQVLRNFDLSSKLRRRLNASGVLAQGDFPLRLPSFPRSGGSTLVRLLSHFPPCLLASLVDQSLDLAHLTYRNLP